MTFKAVLMSNKKKLLCEHKVTSRSRRQQELTDISDILGSGLFLHASIRPNKSQS